MNNKLKQARDLGRFKLLSEHKITLRKFKIK